MFNIRNRIFMVIAYLLCVWLLLFNCATEEETIRPQKPLEGIDLEFLGNRIELQNSLPRNGDEVDVMVIVRNRGNQDAKRIPVFFYDNLRVFSTEEINLEPGGQRRLSTRWRATAGNHVISAVLDPAHHFKEMSREKTEVSTTVLVK
ncbi:MAG: CARDB domain-containing protein [Thermodesulfobacteriota bacterium]